ncbi:MAG: tetratricopeptide repeat protein [bacterium]
MKNDPFYEYRKTKILPEKYQIGMNCFLDTIDDENLGQRVFEEIKLIPECYTIAESPTRFTESGVPALFGVKTQHVFNMHKRIPEFAIKGYKVSKTVLIRLMLENPDMRVTVFEKTEYAKSGHAVKTRVGNIVLKSNAWLIRGNEHWTRKEYAEALRCFDEALKEEPLDARVFQNRGSLLLEIGRYNEAIMCYDSVLEIAPNYIGAWLDKAKALKKLEKYNEAVECYNNALEINPKDSNAWNNKLDIFIKLDRYTEALECVNSAIEVTPQDAELWVNKGGILAQLGKFAEAIECCDRAIDIDPKNSAAWNNKAIFLIGLEKTTEALRCANKAIDLDPKIAAFWKDSGLIKRNRGMNIRGLISRLLSRV